MSALGIPPVTWRTRSWAKPVEKTRGAPSTGRTTLGWRRQVTCFALEARSGGGTAFCTEGRPMTMTDLGLWNDGAVLRRRLSSSGWGKAMAGMYWYCAVWRLGVRRTRWTTAPTEALSTAPPAVEVA